MIDREPKSEAEIIPMPEDDMGDRAWCEMVNGIVAGQGYKIELPTDHFTQGIRNPNDPASFSRFRFRELKGEDGGPVIHTISGVLVGIEWRQDLRGGVEDSVQSIPFARLAYASDITELASLSDDPDAHVFVPLSHTVALVLEK